MHKKVLDIFFSFISFLGKESLVSDRNFDKEESIERARKLAGLRIRIQAFWSEPDPVSSDFDPVAISSCFSGGPYSDSFDLNPDPQLYRMDQL